MATAAYSELKIEGYLNGPNTLTTIQILSSTGTPTSYQLAYPSWQPSVAKRKDAVLSAGSTYDPVIDELTLNIVSTVSAADCLNKLTTLMQLLDQADRWNDSQFYFPVWIYYRPKGSEKNFLYNALILGNRSIDDWAQLPVTYDDVGILWRINGVVIRFVRSPMWLQSDATDTVIGTPSTPFTLTACTLAKAPSRYVSPLDISFGSFNSAAIPQPIPASYLITGNVDDSADLNIVTLNALNLAGVAKYTSVNDAARNAVGTNVMRYTPTDTAYNDSAIRSLNNIFGYTFAVYASVRNNGAPTNTFTVKVNLFAGNAGAASATKFTSQETLIDGSLGTPRIVCLGTVTRITNENPKVSLSIKASVAANSLDIDQLIFVAIDDELTSIIELPAFHITNEVGAGTYDLNVLSNLAPVGLTFPYTGIIPTRSTVLLGTTSPYVHLSAIGDIPVTLRDKTLNWIWLCVAANGVDRWQYVDNANNPLNTKVTIVQRNLAYLVPE